MERKSRLNGDIDGGAVEVRHPPTTHLRLPALCTATALLSGGNLFALAPLAMQLQNKKTQKKPRPYQFALSLPLHFECFIFLGCIFSFAR